MVFFKAHRSMNTKHVYARLLLHKVQKFSMTSYVWFCYRFLIVSLCEYFGLYVLRGCELIIYLPLACLDPTQMGGLSMLLSSLENMLLGHQR